MADPAPTTVAEDDSASIIKNQVQAAAEAFDFKAANNLLYRITNTLTADLGADRRLAEEQKQPYVVEQLHQLKKELERVVFPWEHGMREPHDEIEAESAKNPVKMNKDHVDTARVVTRDELHHELRDIKTLYDRQQRDIEKLRDHFCKSEDQNKADAAAKESADQHDTSENERGLMMDQIKLLYIQVERAHNKIENLEAQVELTQQEINHALITTDGRPGRIVRALTDLFKLYSDMELRLYTAEFNIDCLCQFDREDHPDEEMDEDSDQHQ